MHQTSKTLDYARVLGIAFNDFITELQIGDEMIDIGLDAKNHDGRGAADDDTDGVGAADGAEFAGACPASRKSIVMPSFSSNSFSKRRKPDLQIDCIRIVNAVCDVFVAYILVRTGPHIGRRLAPFGVTKPIILFKHGENAAGAPIAIKGCSRRGVEQCIITSAREGVVADRLAGMVIKGSSSLRNLRGYFVEPLAVAEIAIEVSAGFPLMNDGDTLPRNVWPGEVSASPVDYTTVATET